MQANVNLDALLEKMKAELERAKRFEPLKFDETVEECIDRVRALVEEKERLEKKLGPLKNKHSREKDDIKWAERNLIWMIPLFTFFGILASVTDLGSWAFLLPLFPIALFGSAYLYSANKAAKLEQEIKPLEEKFRKVEKEIEDLGERCGKKLKTYSKQNKTDWRILSALVPELDKALEALAQGDFMTAKDKLEDAESKLRDIAETYDSILDLDWEIEVFHLDGLKYRPCIVDYEIEIEEKPKGISALNFASNVCHVLHYGDMEEARELLEDAQERLRRMREEKWDYSCGNLKFFQYLFEFHYFLLKAVVEAYEAEVGAVAKATQEQAERLAKAKPVEVPQTVEKVTVSAEEPEKELYRGEVRFKMGAMSQERVGTLVITNKRLKLMGKYRLRGTVPTVALKAALRAAGVGEVYEDIPLSEIKFLQLKKALLGGYYLEFKARSKKFTLYTDAAQHIFNLLKQYGAETV